jgi:methylglutaconyl-CoA hydratase
MDELLFAQTDGIAALTLNRPEKRNALHGPLIAELLRLIKSIATDTTIKILMINGNGEHFCAGADIHWMQKIAQGSKKENEQDAERLAELLHQLYFFPKPVMVLAQGAAMGGGLGLIAAADIVIAGSNAQFAFSEVKIGIAPSVISPYVVAAIGPRYANYYFLTAEKFSAADAKYMGLIHKIVEPAHLMAEANTLALQLLQNSPQAMLAAKQLIRHVQYENINVNLSHMTAEHLAHLRASADAQEGLQAFIEKRKPKWKSY